VVCYLEQEYKIQVFENTFHTELSGLQKDEVTEGFGISHNQELHNLYRSPVTVTIAKSRRLL
jgi:hypothetical protein